MDFKKQIIYNLYCSIFDTCRREFKKKFPMNMYKKMYIKINRCAEKCSLMSESYFLTDNRQNALN